MRIRFETLGCKVNQYETQALETILSERGHTVTAEGDDCDVCVINTCTVTAESSRKSRQAIRRAKRTHPGAFIAVCGCLPQISRQRSRSWARTLLRAAATGCSL
jgi:threonylcarbamoyladenosine tRNA methylthiotransferase MtaB